MTVRYAQKQGQEIHILDPATLRISHDIPFGILRGELENLWRENLSEQKIKKLLQSVAAVLKSERVAYIIKSFWNVGGLKSVGFPPMDLDR